MRNKGWIIKLETKTEKVTKISYVGEHGRVLTEDRDMAHRWHYKSDAEMNVARWQSFHTSVSVEAYPK